ncbi:unnamed protein product, partial [Merluccius merluccius]
MFTPRDLEGEVDHSFFDSDSERPSTISTDGTKKKEEEEEQQAANTFISGDYSSASHDARQEGCVARGRPGPGGVGVKGPGPPSELEKKMSRASSSSSIGYTSDTGSRRGGAGTKRPDGNPAGEAPKAPSSGDKDDEDGYYQSQDESEEEDEELQTRPSRRSSGVKGQNLTSLKKLVRRRQTRSASPSSTDTDTDASSDSSDASSPPEPSSSSSAPLTASRAPPPPSSSSSSSSSSSLRRADRSRTPQGESEDTVTDVTPLSTPDLGSPVPGVGRAAAATLGVGKVTLEEEQPIGGHVSVGGGVGGGDAPQEDQDFGSNLDDREFSGVGAALPPAPAGQTRQQEELLVQQRPGPPHRPREPAAAARAVPRVAPAPARQRRRRLGEDSDRRPAAAASRPRLPQRAEPPAAAAAHREGEPGLPEEAGGGEGHPGTPAHGPAGRPPETGGLPGTLPLHRLPLPSPQTHLPHRPPPPAEQRQNTRDGSLHLHPPLVL